MPGVAEVPSVGITKRPKHKLRIAHVSDTHQEHRKYSRAVKKIKGLDVLVHSGDFGYKKNNRGQNERLLADLNKWFGEMGARYNVLVAGNHDMCFRGLTPEEIQARLPNCIYLQDSGCVIEGVSFYGSPWTSASPRSYFCGTSKEERAERWKAIPEGTDIVVTHMPPHGILDLGSASPKDGHTSDSDYFCKTCRTSHPCTRGHWGDKSLLEELVERVKPKAHLYGHVHQCSYHVRRDGIQFVNSAMKLKEEVHWFDFGYDKKKEGGVTPRGGAKDAWIIEKGGHITHRATGMVMDVAGASKEAGTVVLLYPRRERRANQLWSHKSSGQLISKLNKFAVTLMPDGALEMHPCVSAKQAQREGQAWVYEDGHFRSLSRDALIVPERPRKSSVLVGRTCSRSASGTSSNSASATGSSPSGSGSSGRSSPRDRSSSCASSS